MWSREGVRRTGIIGVVVAVCLMAPAGASGAVTVGSNLAGVATDNVCAGGVACTYVQTALPAARRAAGGITAPADGVVVRWRLNSGNTGGSAQLRILRPAAGGGFTGAGTSAVGTVALSEPSANVYTTSLPVRKGDVLGLDNSTSGLFFAATAGATTARFSPFVANGQTRGPTGADTTRELLINADIEPDCDRDGLGDETRDPSTATCGTGTPGAPQRLTGTRITGTAGPDQIFCGPGNSVVNALGGDDRIVCGPGNDRIDAGAGKDSVDGGGGADRILGGTGNDSLTGGTGNDRVSGNSGNDRVRGSSGNDRLSGSSGNDALSGGSGGDRLSGGSGEDSLRSSSGNDALTGGSGRDRLSSGTGSDRISVRDSSRDRVDCGSGRDRVTADRNDQVSRDCERVTRRR